MTDNEIVKALEDLVKCNNNEIDCDNCSLSVFYPRCPEEIGELSLDLINRQKEEIERLKEEVSKTRRKALLEASSKFAGHSDYHGDTILCKLICMAEGKEVKSARPLDKAEIKVEAYKECIEKVKEEINKHSYGVLHKIVINYKIDNLLKEIIGE